MQICFVVCVWALIIMVYQKLYTNLLHCRDRLLMRWMGHRKVAAGDAMTPPVTLHRHSLNVDLSVHLLLKPVKLVLKDLICEL